MSKTANQLSAILEQQLELFELISDSVKKLQTGSITKQRIQSRKCALTENWTSFKDNHKLIISIKTALKVEASQEFEEQKYFRECEENYLEAMEYMSTRLDELNAESTATGKHLTDISANPSFVSNHRLPQLQLPTFNGEYTQWLPFKDTFMAVIAADPALTCVTKLHYLKGCLVGKAQQRLQNLSTTASNFQVAWDDLVSYYDNKRVLVDSAMQALFSAKPVNRESSGDLENLFSDINQALGSLEGLGRNVTQWDDVLIHLVSRKLDAASVKEWENSLGSSTEPPSWTELKTFIITRIRSLQAYERATSTGNIKKPSLSISKHQFKAKSYHASYQQAKQVCSSCKGEHYISSCPGYQSKSLAQRVELLKELQLCYNCLGPHLVNACHSKKRCQKCAGNHHTSIHQANISISGRNPDQSTANNIYQSSASSHWVCADRVPKQTTILATALVKIISRSGEPYIVRAFLDQGSEVNLISQYLLQLLQLPRSHTSLSIVGIGGDSLASQPSKGLVNLTLQSCVNDFTCTLDAYILPKLTSYLPSDVSKNTHWPHLEDIELADPKFDQPARIDLILGVEVYGQILQNGLRKGPKYAPIAQQTYLGWIISGSSLSESETGKSESQSFHCRLDLDLNELVQKFWMQEETFGVRKGQLTPEEKHCEEIFVTTHSRDKEGRYIVRLPFKLRPPTFGDSRTPALKLLHRMQKRFSRDPEFHSEYSKFISEYEKLGHMQQAATLFNGHADQLFYLPHHGVLRESSSTTKLRVVFNGSLKTEKGTSLNDFLYEGQKLQSDLSDVLTRWRIHRFAYSADVVKMFRQIQVHPDDWNFQRILWAENSNLKEFVLTTVTYGTKSAQFLAIRVLNQLAEDEKHRFLDVKNVIKQNTYVDDIYDGSNTIEEGKNRINQIINLFKAGQFELQKWAANDEELLADISKESQATPLLSLCIEEYHIHRTLGLNWQPKLDRFVFISSQHEHPAVYTKRLVLSHAARLFDPLGWLSPVVVKAKMFIQELWRDHLDWDQPIPATLEVRWKNYLNQLHDLSMISVPRWLGLSPSSKIVELHGFADASKAALGAVVYLRVIKSSGTQVTILSSKTKLTPITKTEQTSKRARTVRITTPRLELSAALLLVRLVQHLISVLNLQKSPVHLWTDSSTTLFWILGDPTRWKDFVRNRVSLIQNILPIANWHHIPGEDNPADLASRGSSPRQLAESNLWWQGPSWLKLNEDHWPKLCPTPDENIDQEERHRSVVASVQKDILISWDLIQRYSSLTRLLRITAWCMRAVVLFRQGSRTATSLNQPSPLTPSELNEAKIFWIKKTQNIYFKSELNQLSKLEPISNNSSLYRLIPFIDSQGILRIGGRLRNAQIDADMKHPIILPKDSLLTRLVLDHTHRLTFHGGVQLMLVTIRRNFWVLGGRNPVRSFVHRCVICARHRAVTAKQLMGQLPVSRTIPSRPFLHSGVDYAGPFTLKVWRGRTKKTYKSYLVVFVCFSSSAVHLELATDYSTEGFLAAYKRFTSRRGICATLASDCGSNFVGADAELRRLFTIASKESHQIADRLANDGTKWIFNPPAASHFGGKWEAAVKSAKFHIKRTIGETLLTYEEFTTLLLQIEAVLNSRPICPLTDDASDMEALTPGHFIAGDAINAVPEPSLVHLPDSKLSRYQLLRKMLEQFWRRWSIEYLQRLQEIVKWQKTEQPIKEGALVLIADERYPPTKWPLGRVILTHPGVDGHTRVVTVRTQSSTLKRPIIKLCPLPLPLINQETPNQRP